MPGRGVIRIVGNGDWGIRELGRVGRNTYADNVVHGNALGDYRLQHE